MSEAELVPVNEACDPIFYSPTQPDRIKLNGQEVEIKGKQRQEIIKILLDNGVPENCIRQAIASWWKRKDPAKYLSAVKHKLKLKESTKELQNAPEELILEKEEQETPPPQEESTPEPVEEQPTQFVSIITPELIGLAYGSILEIVIAFLNIRYNKSYDPTDIFPDFQERMKLRGESLYKVLDALGLLQERYIQLMILMISVGGGIGSDIIELSRFYSKEEKKEEEKKLEGKNAVENALQLKKNEERKTSRYEYGVLEGVLG